MFVLHIYLYISASPRPRLLHTSLVVSSVLCLFGSALLCSAVDVLSLRYRLSVLVFFVCFSFLFVCLYELLLLSAAAALLTGVSVCLFLFIRLSLFSSSSQRLSTSPRQHHPSPSHSFRPPVRPFPFPFPFPSPFAVVVSFACLKPTPLHSPPLHIHSSLSLHRQSVVFCIPPRLVPSRLLHQMCCVRVCLYHQRKKICISYTNRLFCFCPSCVGGVV